MTKNVIVLGAGIIGVSTAIHLQRRGRQVTLIDRKAPGSETSFGNAGLIQREGVVPYGFPQQLGLLIRYAFNNRIDAHYHLRALLVELEHQTPRDDLEGLCAADRTLDFRTQRPDRGVARRTSDPQERLDGDLPHGWQA
jgi:NADPH-dependent 2,4-dienoyl-CoA reductase/sulfur reductase-like enzyme